MPKVGGKHYSYTSAGMAAAKKESKRTGKPMTNVKKKAMEKAKERPQAKRKTMPVSKPSMQSPGVRRMARGR
jgi:hypothetical protein